QVTNGVPNISYLWNTGDTSPDLNNLYSGTYVLTVIDGNNCTGIDTAILIDPVPLVLTIDSIVIYDVFTTPSGGLMPYYFQWVRNTVVESTNEDPINLPPGIYIVTLSDSLGCKTTDTIQIDINTSLEIGHNDLTVKVYPNPSSGEFKIQSEETILWLRLWDLRGRLVYEKQARDKNIYLNLQELSSEKYLVEIELLDGKKQYLPIQITK
ncbi:MAG: T9SS type A sorting domain-containing protein, partial [Flavobacteriales bacterium]|nr:T9SS type A sorting domain-containing protein [Flavobacteriales bacterium]